jgi:DNA-directed RNA polymerase specialized sigma24 family protein
LKARTTPSRQETQAVNTNTADHRHDEIGTFFAANADRLHRTVQRAARAPEQTIQDACQTAWTILLRRPDIPLDARGYAWLVTVATRQAWGLASIAAETPVGSFQAGDSDDAQMPEPVDRDDRSAEQRALARIEHDERVAAFATLKPRERQALYLKGSGYSYHEIAGLSGVVCVVIAWLSVLFVDDMSLSTGWLRREGAHVAIGVALRLVESSCEPSLLVGGVGESLEEFVVEIGVCAGDE